MIFTPCVLFFFLGILCPFVFPGHELKTGYLIPGLTPDPLHHTSIALKVKGIELLKYKSTGLSTSYVSNRCVNGGSCPEKEQELNHISKLKFIK